MRPASATFLEAVRSSHTMTARARAVAPGQTGNDPDGIELEILGGDVQLDANADVRGTLDLTTAGRWWPASSSDPLAPYGQELFIERGVKFGNGSTEWVSLGYFRLKDVEQEGAPLGGLRAAADDRMAGLIDAKLLAPVQFSATTTRGTVVEQLVTDVYPGAVIVWDDASDSEQLGRAVVAEKDRFKFLHDLVTAAGKVWWWDHAGQLIIKSRPDLANPVAVLDAGEGGVLVQLDRSLSRDGAYNAVVAEGEAPDGAPPVRAAVVDNNPSSPTYYYGTFGHVPRFYSSDFLTTNDQAKAAASSLLRQTLGLPYNVNLSAVPNPALEPLDPVTVRYPDRPRVRQLREEAHVLDQLTIPLTPADPLEAKTREQTAAEIGVIS